MNKESTHIVHFSILEGVEIIEKYVKVSILLEKGLPYNIRDERIISAAIDKLNNNKAAEIEDKSWIIQSVERVDLDFEVEVNKQDISFDIVSYIDGVFNHPDVVCKLSFFEAERFLLMMYKNNDYMPQYGDCVKSDENKEDLKSIWSSARFVIVSKDFYVDDYSEIKLTVIPEKIFYKQFR